MTQLEVEIAELKNRVERLESIVLRLPEQSTAKRKPPLTEEQERLVAWLREERLIREATAEERQRAAAWESLSEEEKQAIRDELDHVSSEPMTSDIVLQNRR